MNEQEVLVGQNCSDPNPKPFVDTPVLAAKRQAFDEPTQANLDALIAAVRAEPSPESDLSLLRQENERLKEELARVLGFPDGAHGDLPRPIEGRRER